MNTLKMYFTIECMDKAIEVTKKNQQNTLKLKNRGTEKKLSEQTQQLTGDDK